MIMLIIKFNFEVLMWHITHDNWLCLSFLFTTDARNCPAKKVDRDILNVLKFLSDQLSSKKFVKQMENHILGKNTLMWIDLQIRLFLQ